MVLPVSHSSWFLEPCGHIDETVDEGFCSHRYRPHVSHRLWLRYVFSMTGATWRFPNATAVDGRRRRLEFTCARYLVKSAKAWRHHGASHSCTRATSWTTYSSPVSQPHDCCQSTSGQSLLLSSSQSEQRTKRPDLVTRKPQCTGFIETYYRASR